MRDVNLIKWAVFGLVIALAVFGAIQLNAWLNPPPVNLLLISVDTLRADHLGCYGYDKPTSPVADRLAEEGILFERFISPRGLTHPALATMLTGLETFHHKVRFNYHKPQGLTTIADVLNHEGYQCRAYLSNADDFASLGFDSESQGFTSRYLYNQTKRDLEITNRGIEFLESQNSDSKQPFFLWLHYMNPHRPYTPPEPYQDGLIGNNRKSARYYDRRLEQYMAARADLSSGTLAEIIDYYDGCVRFTDDLIGQVLASLKAKGLDQNTLVVFTADHGDELYDHLHYFLHQVSMFDGTLHIPLIIRQPGKMPGGLRVKESVGLVHLMPTLIDLLGIDYQPARALDGQSFRNLAQTYIDNKPSADAQELRLAWQNRPILIEMVRPEGNAYGVYKHPYKYVRTDYLEGHSGFITQPIQQSDRLTTNIVYPPEMLFDLVQDPDELINLIQQKQSIRDKLSKLIETTLKENPDWETVDVSVIDKEGLERLRKMGYVDGDRS